MGHRMEVRCSEKTLLESSLLTILGGGSQFGKFRKGEGDWAAGGALAKSRTCDGAMNDGDTFKVDWIIDGDDGIPNADQDR
jgi:hypothetical protein